MLIEIDEENKKQMRGAKRNAQEQTKRENDRLREIKEDLKRTQAEHDMKMIKENM